MIADMTTSVATVAWIGAGGVIIGAVVGALASWVTAVVTSRRAAGEARDARRREAYGAFLGSLDEILSLYLTPEDFGRQLKEDPDFAPLARKALSSISRTSVGVILSGSEEARTAVKGIEDARWGLYAILKKPDDLAGLSSLLQQIAELQVSFGDLAKEELVGPPRRGILRKHRPSAARGGEVGVVRT
jgi:hypothetical protein